MSESDYGVGVHDCAQYCARSNGQRLVTVTLPDGKVESFRAKTFPECQSIATFTDVALVFEPIDGTDSKLEQTDFGALKVGTIAGQVGSHIFDTDTLTPADPRHYRLTTTEGMVYELDQFFGLSKVIDPVGNTLTYTANGIQHSGGLGLTFQRDAQGRIFRVFLPSSRYIEYHYDNDGNLHDKLDAAQQTTSFAYSPLTTHYLKDIIDPRHIRVVRNEYDDSGRLVRTIDADGKPIIYTHDIAGRTEQVRDRRGYLSTYVYDDNGRVLSESNALGETTHHTYDTDGNELTRKDPLDHTTTWTYDTRGNKLTEEDALHHVTTFTYGEHNGLETQVDAMQRRVIKNSYEPRTGLLVSSEDASHALTEFGYDLGMLSNNTGELRSIKDALGHTTSHNIDQHGWRTSSTDALNHVTTVRHDALSGRETGQSDTWTNADGNPTTDASGTTYDANGRVTQTTSPSGVTTVITYAGLDHPASECDWISSRCTTHTYDAQGRETRTDFRDGTFETRGYDENGNVIAQTDRAGRTTRMTYDEANRLLATIHPDEDADDSNNPFTLNHYDKAGRLDAVSDELGHTTHYGYDDANRRTTVTDELDHTTTTKYDDSGRRTAVIDALQRTTRFDYDLTGRLTRTTYDDGSFTSTTYDAAGRKTSETDQAGRITRFAYDAVNRLIAVVLPNPANGANPAEIAQALTDGQSVDAAIASSGVLVTRYAYDELGRKTRQTDALGHTTRWGRYLAGATVEIRTLPGGQSERMDYDYWHRLATHTNFRGTYTSYTYDAEDRVKGINVTGLTPITLSYTPTGQLKTATDANGVTRYTYDARSRVTQVSWPNGATIDYRYDAVGNRTQLKTANQQVDYGYDELNRLETVTAIDAGTPSPTGPAVRYHYDDVGNRESVTRANGTTTTYAYNRLNRLTGIAHKAGASLLLGLTYTLDPTGMRTAIDETGSINRHVDYTYDEVKRLTKEQVTQAVGNRTTSWTYDAVGNRLTQAKTIASGTATTGYVYDSNDRLTSDNTNVSGIVTGSAPGATTDPAPASRTPG